MGCPGACPIENKEESKQIDEALKNEDEPTNPKTKKFYALLAIIFIIVFLFIFLGVKWIYPEKSIITERMEYNGFEFEKIAGLWHTEWVNNDQSYIITLRYNPKEVEEVPVFGTITETFNQRNIYLSFDPTANFSEFKYTALANSELSLSLAKAFGKNPIAACIKNKTNACADRPIVNCETKNKSVIIVSANGDPAVLMKENCIILKGAELDILKSADKLLYTWYRIMYPIPIPLEELQVSNFVNPNDNSNTDTPQS
ncbi:hypothetical protein GF358_03735 [Candidatus Woesearchaeota archaeon]|nr:hypothetical protein [Candidatus Woesearchaeota archaeon]